MLNAVNADRLKDKKIWCLLEKIFVICLCLLMLGFTTLAFTWAYFIIYYHFKLN
jgi:hypothetical protein